MATGKKVVKKRVAKQIEEQPAQPIERAVFLRKLF